MVVALWYTLNSPFPFVSRSFLDVWFDFLLTCIISLIPEKCVPKCVSPVIDLCSRLSSVLVKFDRVRQNGLFVACLVNSDCPLREV
jgi:hypothetical protein